MKSKSDKLWFLSIRVSVHTRYKINKKHYKLGKSGKKRFMGIEKGVSANI